MRVAVCPSDKTAVGWYRLGLPAATLQAQGENVEFSFLPGLPMRVVLGHPAGLADDFDADVLILQRPMGAWQVIGARDAQKRGIAVVVELDDDFHAIDKRSAFGRQVTAEHLRALGECCKLADLVTVSTPALAERYAPRGRVAVLPNCVPGAWLDISPERAGNIVGWTGTLGNHRDDLKAACGGVGMAVDEHGAVFRAWGAGNLDAVDTDGRRLEGYGLEALKRDLCLTSDPDIHPWLGMEDYPHKVAKLDVGIAPLADTVFNRAKSWLKPLEYAALGVPCVMSPTDEYRRINRYGAGVTANYRSRDWRSKVGRLLVDADCRAEVAECGREVVREYLTMEANAHKWAEAWESALVRMVA